MPDLLLWRGVEMVEILSTLRYGYRALGGATVPSGRRQRSQRMYCAKALAKSIVTLIHGVRDMAAIRRLNATHNDFLFLRSRLITSVEMMLLAMVDDFRCVVIKSWPSESLICAK